LLIWQGKLTLLLTYGRRDYLWSLLFGALNPCLYYLVLFEAYDLLPAQEAQAINYTWALSMALLAVPLLGHRLRFQELAAALICYFGVLVIATRGDPLGLEFANLNGVLLALFSTLIWALYWILNTRDHRDPVAGLFINFAFALPLIVGYCYFTGELTTLPERVNAAAAGGAIYVGLVEMGVSFVFWLNAMKYTESTARISNLIFISPFLSLIFINLFIGEQILPSTLIGLGLILCGLMVNVCRKRSR
jgi:drug/metabolite transporter (DMT)-like permease